MASPLRVLILEGEPTDAELMLDALRQAAFAPHWRRVDTKEDYLAGLVPAPDVILADYHLPEFDARWALGRLRERGLDIPFIIVTGSLNEEAAVECMTQGAADYLLKDRLSRLGPAVARVLHEKRLRDEQRRAEAERFLAKASALLAGSLDFEGTLQSLALLAVPFLADRCVVELAGGDETIRLVRSAHADSTKEERARELYHRLRQRPETDPVSVVLRTRQSLLLAEVTDESLGRMAPDDEWLAAAREFGVRSAIFVPLLAGGRTLGAVSFAMVESGRRYGSADLALVEELTRRVALAVDHARLYREAQRTADQLRLLIEVGRAAGQSLELHQVLQQIVDTLGERLNVDRCFIRLLEPGGFLPVRAIHAPDPELRERTLGSVVRLEDSLSGIVIRKRGVVSLEDARQNTFLSPAIGARLAPATWIHHAPILGRDGPIGSLIVSARSERRPFRADDAALVEAVARQAAIAIDNARLYEEARRRSERLAALVEVARAISATLDPDSIYAIAFEQLQRLVPGDRYAIAVYDPERHGFRLVAVRCAPGLADPWPVGTFVPEDEALGALACRHGHTIIIPDARQDPMPLVRQAAESGIGSAAVTPILADGAWLGSLSVLSRQVDGFDESHLPVLDAFAAQIAVALQNAATHARLAVSLTEVKATQEHLVQIERLRAVGELASGVAHDL
ncbi:MAG: GAF domain-containing protein [Chloroflexi bacterium]|nr:GAF domain-containing protein [Chloroflexota bacterium]